MEFERLYEEHIWTVYGFIGYRVATTEEAEDLTQGTFERAHKAWSRFDASKASEATWLLAIARNLVIDHYRRVGDRSTEPLPDSDSDSVVGDLRTSDAPELGLEPDLEQALSRLSDRDREVLALRFGGDLKGTEIAEITGIGLANVQQILSRSLRRLREELSETRDQ